MSTPSNSPAGPWYAELNRYQWWVLLVATLGWLFDSMDQRLFVLARTPALRDLIPGATDSQIANYAGLATSIFILGWATGGLVFGLFGDRWGRTRTMTLTIVTYSLFTGLSACATSWYDFAAYRFFCGMGIGGEYAAGVALVAETMPARARPYCLGLLQGLSALGHVVGSIISYFIGPQTDFYDIAGWRWLFAVGVVPALLAIIIRMRLREPEQWLQAREQSAEAADSSAKPDELQKQLGDWREIFRNRQLLYHVVIGMSLGVCGQIGLWGIGYWTPELIRGSQMELRRDAIVERGESAVDHDAIASGSLTELAKIESTDSVDADQLAAQWHRADDQLVARGTILQDTAGMFGIYAFTLLTTRTGRRPAFAVAYLLAFVVTVFVFSSMRTADDVYWMAPLLGFSISSVYGGFAIYFPELFPTRLRSTGTGLCYNVARYVTAFGPLLLGRLTAMFAAEGASLPLREAAATLAVVYLLGIVATWFAPETHGKPLPE
ncbi:MAG: MFS transporter [Pirellulales bacterium]